MPTAARPREYGAGVDEVQMSAARTVEAGRRAGPRGTERSGAAHAFRSRRRLEPNHRGIPGPPALAATMAAVRPPLDPCPRPAGACTAGRVRPPLGQVTTSARPARRRAASPNRRLAFERRCRLVSSHRDPALKKWHPRDERGRSSSFGVSSGRSAGRWVLRHQRPRLVVARCCHNDALLLWTKLTKCRCCAGEGHREGAVGRRPRRRDELWGCFRDGGGGSGGRRLWAMRRCDDIPPWCQTREGIREGVRNLECSEDIF
ncbi:unnamed protein product [Urochloa humidicola]